MPHVQLPDTYENITLCLDQYFGFIMNSSVLCVRIDVCYYSVCLRSTAGHLNHDSEWSHTLTQYGSVSDASWDGSRRSNLVSGPVGVSPVRVSLVFSSQTLHMSITLTLTVTDAEMLK